VLAIDGVPEAVTDPAPCVCGCGRWTRIRHHCLYRQELRWHARHDFHKLVQDPRNLVYVHPACHAAHHNRQKPLRLAVLPDSVFAFAVEVMGAGPAYEYIRRRYQGEDERLDGLLGEEKAA
jgi:hypothetical protein